MSIPDYQTIMLPLLQLASDGNECHIGQAKELLADKFNLTEEERNEMLSNRRQTLFYNRVGWARTYLVKAGLLESTKRGYFRITPRGKEVLNQKPTEINKDNLKRFTEFQEFIGTSEISNDTEQAEIKQTPEEMLDEGYKSIRNNLSQEVFVQIKNCTPQFFEKLVVDLLVAMGYGGSRQDAGQAVGRAGDEGIDGIIKEDKLGLDVIYVQAKRWANTVGRPEVQAFAGSIEGKRAKKGVFITTSKFSPEANQYVNNIEKKIILIDGEQLVNLMIDYNIGVAEEDRYIVKRIDTDYFTEE